MLDRNAGVGGTWHENKYPGCACDVPAHSYNPTFEQNPNWSSFYVGTDEIEQYFCDFSRRHDLYKHIAFNTKLSSARWDEQHSRCASPGWEYCLKHFMLTESRSTHIRARARRVLLGLVPCACERLRHAEQAQVYEQSEFCTMPCQADQKPDPNLSGLQEFKGPMIHTAAWGKTDLRGKKVAVIGNGSSAAQVVPALYIGRTMPLRSSLALKHSLT